MVVAILHAISPFILLCLFSPPFSVTSVTDERRRASVCLFSTGLPESLGWEAGGPSPIRLLGGAPDAGGERLGQYA